MGQITAGTGLISGIDIAGLIDQLIALEQRPKQLVEQRNAVLTAQQTAYQDVNAKLLGLKFNVDGLTGATTYTATTGTTSNESVLTVESGAGAVPGNYSFTVDRLVSSQQVLTKGFKDIDSTAVGSGTLTFESGRSRLDSKTLLSDLNGGAGANRGLIRVTDRSGAVGLIDLSRAVTVNDVIDAISSTTNVSVLASVTADGLTLTDNTGLGSGNLTITNVGITDTATSLGIVGVSATGEITGTDINFLGEDTSLAAINDGVGIDIRDSGGAEFSIFGGDSTEYQINLLAETTLGEVIDTINAATGGVVVASIAADGVSLTLTDTGSGGGNFSVVAGSSTAAADLGLSGDDADGDKSINGDRIIAGINSKLLNKLNGGAGLGATTATARVLTVGTPLTDVLDGVGVTTTGVAANLKELVIFNRDGSNGSPYTIDLDPSNTVGDLIGLVDAGTNGTVTMTISGNTLVLTDNTGGGANLRVYDNPGSQSTIIADLGLTIDAATSTVTGVDTNPLPTATTQTGAGQISLQDRAGVTFTADLTNAKSVTDAITGINEASAAAGAGITIALNRAGNGLTLTDASGGTGDIIVSDTTGATATNLGIAGNFSADEVESGNLQYQYLTEGTSLNSIGFVPGKFKITDSTGSSATVDLTQGELTIFDVLADINSRGLDINAKINDNGDGIVIEDTNAGTAATAITIEEAGSGTAASLGILGAAATAGGDFDGSFEQTVDYTSGTMTSATLLSALKSGNGIDYEGANPDFKITTKDGTSFDVDLTVGITTVGEMITAIQDAATAAGSNVTVSIHENGTSLTLVDNTAGAGRLDFEALNGSDALGDLGFTDDTDDDGQSGSTTLVTVTTLRDLADLINDSNAGVSAAIINDGSAGAPFRLILSSDKSGSAGSFIFDDGGAGFKGSTFSEAQDAVVFFGSSDPAKAQIITSTSNTLEDVIPGADINLLATSDQPVQVTIAQDNDAIVSSAQAFVTGFNALMTTIDTYDAYNSDTEERGLLLGESALSQLKNRLFSSIVSRSSDLTGSFTSLAQVGIKVGSGAVLQMDAEKFQNALDTDRDAVINLFTFKETELDSEGETVITAKGVGIAIDELIERLTDTENGIIESRVAAIDRQLELNQDRIERLDAAVEVKRARLEAQFIAMESALAQLQGQSSALSSFQPVSFSGGASG
jgi:flagellar hook-associated protein 2